MLRDSLEAPIAKEIPLLQEVEYIKNYIELQKLISTNMKITFNFTGGLSGRLILPRLLLSFNDENLKYYELNNMVKPVDIYLNSNHEQLLLGIVFSTNFNKNNNINELPITRKVFNLFYSNKYKIEKERLSAQFINKLTLYW